jgi:hypothetical protein
MLLRGDRDAAERRFPGLLPAILNSEGPVDPA